MKLSTKARYGTRALIELAILNQDEPTMLSYLAEKQELPVKYLESLMVSLRNAGVVTSIRGNKGGYILAKNKKDITLYDIVSALDGDVCLAPCINHKEYCNKIDSCYTVDYWKDLQDKIKSHLHQITLEEIVRNTVKKQKELE